MATHFSVLAWKIPGTGEPGGLPSMWLHRVGHNWSDLAAAADVTVKTITSSPVQLPTLSPAGLRSQVFWGLILLMQDSWAGEPDVAVSFNWAYYILPNMYGCKSWTVKKAECWRIDAFELWCWRRLLRVPWTTKRSNQSILKEVRPGCSLEGMMLKLKLQCFGHLMWRVDSLENTLMLGGIGGRRKRGNRGWDGLMASPIRWTWVWVNSRR